MIRIMLSLVVACHEEERTLLTSNPVIERAMEERTVIKERTTVQNCTSAPIATKKCPTVLKTVIPTRMAASISQVGDHLLPPLVSSD